MENLLRRLGLKREEIDRIRAEGRSKGRREVPRVFVENSGAHLTPTLFTRTRARQRLQKVEYCLRIPLSQQEIGNNLVGVMEAYLKTRGSNCLRANRFTAASPEPFAPS